LLLPDIYLKQGKSAEVLAEAEKARSGVSDARSLAYLGYFYAAAGARNEAIRILDEVKRQSREHYNLEVPIAAIYIALGDREQAFAWLEKAYQDREQGVAYLKVDTHFDSLRSDPRFADLLRRLRLAS